ncbi:esterase-like activity of phytase family protein [Pseudomonas sp. 2FG]|uniref:esterase-like activity of phytase family protein n=1 Tax=Pseudomonas sp. 2FG TaxID=2502191 RepID=UPI0010F647FA|nr:esterase-like activity of phytase family protein [Pseudomonas sp. 2FG]
MRRLFAALLLMATSALAQALDALQSAEELQLLAEQPVEGMRGGNLSGLAWCGDALWAVSDREDDRLYRLTAGVDALHAEAELFQAPAPPDNGLPWGLRMRTWVASLVRGGAMDFEGLSCDAKGNRYLLSEAHAGVLQIPLAGTASWLSLPPNLVRQARASGMLLHFNAQFEGVAVDPAGERLWLAAERERRGLLVLHQQQSSWRCSGGCVLFGEGGNEAPPAQLDSPPRARDFSDVALLQNRLFTLERLTQRICRRTLASGEVERCWSFAKEALTDARRYSQPFGAAEGLWLDAQGAWIGVDNGGKARGDGETRPIVWRFAAPAGGWGATP